MAESQPIFYDPQEFSREVLQFSLREIGWLPPRSYIPGEAEFVESVQIVGKAVFTLQVIKRNRLRPLFIECVHLNAGIDGHGYDEINEFMGQCYLQSGTYNTILSLFAIIGELILFFGEFGITVPPELYTFPWCSIYEYRLRDVLLFKGGFEQLRDEAKHKYIDTDLYEETLVSFRNNRPIPYAEESGDLELPDDTTQFLRERLGEDPNVIDVAMNILRHLYHEQGMVPPPAQAPPVQ